MQTYRRILFPVRSRILFNMSLIFDIKRYSINDGPGIRITIFFKGCPLSCAWCHNPKGISVRSQKMYTHKRCLGCGICIRRCPVTALSLTGEGIHTDPHMCRLCGICTDNCPANAMEMSGIPYTVEELMRGIKKEAIFMDQSGGGVTFCGGEPLMHAGILIELLKRCGKQEIHRAVDTTLFASQETVEQVMQHTDLFLVDLKHMDTEKHRKFCGVPNERILSNIELLAAAGRPMIIRIPLIEGVNTDPENMWRTTTFIGRLPGEKKVVQLLPYHDIGKGKHEKLGSLYNPQHFSMSCPEQTTQENWLDMLQQAGIDASIGG